MAAARRRPVAVAVTELNDVVPNAPDSSPTDDASAREKLRQRWELASVLNFLHVFEPVIESDLKISGKDIETALIEQNETLAQLHVALLKGIFPSNKPVKCSDDWVITLSKTLSKWWPWVATGEFPLTGAKGEEISVYKELEPTTRLLILKALCEVRAEQYDVVSYINEETRKNGTELSNFRKEKVAGNENGIAYWYDGNETIGHRLYKEVLEYEGVKGKGTVPAIYSQWETLATNFEEFNKMVNEFSSSGIKWEVDFSKSLQTNVIPVLERQWKKKQRAQHRQQREQKLLNGFRNSRLTRSCRNQKPIDYKYDNYDKSITEAIQYANKRKTTEERRQEEKLSQRKKTTQKTSNESNNSENTSTDGETTESDAERNIHQERDGDDDDGASSHEEYDDEKEDNDNQNRKFVKRSKGSRFSTRLAGVPGHTVAESINLGAKNRLRQRPYVNTAFESTVVPDSDDERSSPDTRRSF